VREETIVYARMLVRKFIPAALVIGFAASIGLTIGCTGSDPDSSGATATAVPTLVEGPGHRAEPSPTPTPTVESPVLAPRTPTPGLDQGGVFGDGRTSLPAVDTTGWLTYENERWGYAFRYPPEWSFEEWSTDRSAYGHPSLPRQTAVVLSPREEWGENIPGQNCEAHVCAAMPPHFLGFYVEVAHGGCAPGLLVAEGPAILDGETVDRCVIKDSVSDSRIAVYAFPSPVADEAGEYQLVVAAHREREVTLEEQAVLEAILASFVLR
jgi:hypothetical protein